MKVYKPSNDLNAVSEVVGGILLLIIAVLVFSAIYAYVFPLPLPSSESHIKIVGYVNDEGTAILEHVGGESISSYRIDVRNSYNVLIDSKIYIDDSWEIGECNIPTSMPLLLEDDKIRISVYKFKEDGSEEIVFDGILSGKYEGSALLSGYPLLISSLLTNTIDEDLICYCYSINSSIEPFTYIHNWSVDGNSIMDLLIPFDTNSTSSVKDYSGNENNGIVFGSTWDSNGIVGGAYSFDGDDYISIPYCFDSDYLSGVTVEIWIKTTMDSAIIMSYNSSKYFELAISNGLIKWTTTANSITKEITGIHNVSNGIWHLVSATYDSSTGSCGIYVDGEIDAYGIIHNPGNLLGSGGNPSGTIGLGSEAVEETIFSTSFETQEEKNSWNEHNNTEGGLLTWDTLCYDNFNNDWGRYTDGGTDCTRTSDFKYEGSYSARIIDNSGTSSSFYLTNGVDVDNPGYTSISIDFWWMWNDYDSLGNPGWETDEDWWIRYYDGSQWNTILDMNYPSGFSEDSWYHEILYINESEYTFPNDMQIRFQCSAEANNEMVYIDQVFINATAGSRTSYDFDLRNSDDLNPRSGTYSIGGSGDFDPEFTAFNRSGIDISGYNNVELSVWYSYKDTESTDFFGLYYLYNQEWVNIFEIDSPDIGSGQLAWTNLEIQIPDDIDELILQFNWTTSDVNEFVAIDDLEITGVPLGSGNNFSGVLDELHIYNRVLSTEQIHQNYLCTKNGVTSRSVIVSDETDIGERWKCTIIPNDRVQDDEPLGSNVLIIVNYGGG